MQSTAIAALIVHGKIPKPDLAVIADTGREMSTTWDYLNKITIPALASVGVVLHRVRKNKYSTVDLYSGKAKNKLLIPAFTTFSGEMSKLPTYCSSEWKLRVIQRWATKEHQVKAATLWMGMSVDELRRVKLPLGKWEKHYPLVQLKLTRQNCIDLVQLVGWPTPPRSSCYMCPNHREEEWEWQQRNAPKDFQQAIKFEKYVQKKDPTIYLHSSGTPLSQVKFDSSEEVMSGACSTGLCFV